jgi:YHS domain-containing protein
MRMNLSWAAAVALLGGCVFPLDRAPRTDSSFFSLKDPVCGVTCFGDKCERETFQDKQFFFCSKECKKKFDEGPAPYFENH